MKYCLALGLVLAVCEAGVGRRMPYDKGSIDSYIVGGSTAASGEVPWIVSIGGPSHFCGGSIINARTVLTAAHCVDGDSPSGIKIRVGSLAPNSGGTQLGVRKIIVHKGYDPYEGSDNDIALLLLSSDIPLNGNNITPVNMPAPNSEPANRQTVLIAGWGRIYRNGPLPPELLKVNVNIVDRKTCIDKYENTPYTVTDNMICAGVDGGGKDSCQGDSGGPLTQGNVQIGVVSWGEGCALPDYPGVYTHVANYLDWIKENKS